MKLSAAWTCQPARAADCGGYRHFAVLGQRGRGRERTVELQAVLDPDVRLLVPAGELRDRTAWLPGWQRLPREEGPPVADPVVPISDLSVNFSISTADQ